MSHCHVHHLRTWSENDREQFHWHWHDGQGVSFGPMNAAALEGMMRPNGVLDDFVRVLANDCPLEVFIDAHTDGTFTLHVALEPLDLPSPDSHSVAKAG